MKNNALKDISSAAVIWYEKPSFAVAVDKVKLNKTQVGKLLEIIGNNQTDAEKKEFEIHIGRAIESYIAAKKFINEANPKKVGKQLKWLLKTSNALLIDPNGIENLNAVAQLLCNEELSKENTNLSVVLRSIVALVAATDRAITVQKQLPNKWKDHALHNLAHRIAIIMRDFVGVQPTKSDTGKFAQLVRYTACIAGRKSVSKETIYAAIDRLKKENVIKSNSSSGMKKGKKIFKETPVSDLSPVVVGKEKAGKPIYSYSLNADGTVTEHPVRYTNGEELIYVTSSD